VEGRATNRGFVLSFASTGRIGATFLAYWQPLSGSQEVLQYTVGAGKTLEATPRAGRRDYDCAVYGPNGYLREFRGSASDIPSIEVTSAFDADARTWFIELNNHRGDRSCDVCITDNAYLKNRPVRVVVPPGGSRRVPWRTASGWYDASVRVVDDLAYFRRLAGCVASGSASATTDPAIGNRDLFKPNVSVSGSRHGTLRFDYVTPPWLHHAGNWLGVFQAGAEATAANLLYRITAPRGTGSAALPGAGHAPLLAGKYEVWYFASNSYRPLVTQPAVFTLLD
jgi:phospholipase C